MPRLLRLPRLRGLPGPLFLVAALVSTGGSHAAVAAAPGSTEAACPEDAVPEAAFADTAGNPHEPAIECVAWHDIAAGTTPTTFSPAEAIRRDQMASVLARLLDAAGVRMPTGAPQGFQDVDGNPHATRINQLTQLGVVRGTNDGTYGAADAVRRDQMATFLVRAYELADGESLDPASDGSDAFDDTDANEHEPNVAKAAEAGFAAGVTADRYEPGEPVRRDQMAGFVARVLDRLASDGHVETATDQGGVDHGEDISLANTGPRVDDLEEVGSITTSHDGQLIEGKRVVGRIEVRHADVTIRDVEVVSDGGDHAIYSPTSHVHEATNTRVEWTHVDGSGTCESRGIVLYGRGATVYRSSVVGKSSGGLLTTGDRWIESFSGDREEEVANGGCHGSGLSAHGASGFQVLRSRLEMQQSGSSALSLYPRVRAITDALVKDSLFNGGSYCLYGGYTGNHPHRDENHDIRVVGNKFGRQAWDECGEYGPVTAWNPDQSGNEWTDNTWRDTGEPVSP